MNRREKTRWLGGVLTACLLVAPDLAAADCEIEGVASIDRLRVRIPGQRLRSLAVVDLPVAVRPGRGTRYRDVRVLAPLSFAARTDAVIPWAAREDRELLGMLRLGPEVVIESVLEEPDEEMVSVRARVDERVWVARVNLPCDDLMVGIPERSAEQPAWTNVRGPRWLPNRDSFYLTSAPHDGASIRVEAPDGLRRPMIEIGRSDHSVRVLAMFPNGTALRGWIPQRQLRAAPDVPIEPDVALTVATRPRAASCPRRASGANEYVGPARLTPGAIVQTQAEGGEAWATVAESTTVTVSWRPGTRWVRIVHVPGLLGDRPCPDVLQVAYIARQAVTLAGGSNVPSEPGEIPPQE